MRLFVVAGETSGDTHAAALLAELQILQPDLHLSGLGGPKLHALSHEVEDWTDQAAVVGLWDVLCHYGWFRKKFHQTLARIASEKPDAVLLVDYPGFNLRLAKALQPHRPRTRLLYYISPQVWAWNRGRLPMMARCLDRMFCIFPFEKDLYRESGLPTDFVGHPMTTNLVTVGDEPRQADLLALLPGSRGREVKKIFPLLLEAAGEVQARRPQTILATSAASPKLQVLMRDLVRRSGMVCQVGLHNARELMQTAGAGLVASGTATLEAALCGLPYALVYKVAPLTYLMGRLLIRVPYLGMANILADRPIIKEFIQGEATTESLSTEALRLLNHAEDRARLRSDFLLVREKLIAPTTISPAEAVRDALT